ncbi:uroporphyrinogen-III C-methyltransferase [Hyphomicrobium sp.]|jgi:uroporphyrin-III C-methyltransferase/precorrin-2 dehydrogenase/sirohydrochlorin ferrochelatase|uniref:uroporphyrinogen-III C-methyltransferase n=1 Tax=Hyphomicrobium sp. TaxID=82 RepID=UPI002C114958|nr:uroporphyrinogen-III C-methyltransferase [Hyphomicrobium sp.]HVZ03336.1 uroporphyrinogen-III C-methyltransferase [Hyphomicrobium sp.]
MTFRKKDTHVPAQAAPATLEQLVRWRRDVRRFKTDPVPDDIIQRLLRLADLAPSVGNSQPWRILNVKDAGIRAAIAKSFEAERRKSAEVYKDDKASLYNKLKLAGFDTAPVHLAIFCDRDAAQGHGLGRQTMPETLDSSCACMVTTLWLAAREAGLGLGWVSIVDPSAVTTMLGVPKNWKFIGYLLLGWPEEEHLDPELERHGWQARTPFESRYSELGSAERGPSQHPQHVAAKGAVALVGAGPGDPDLLTIKALRALQSADAVLFDDLVAKPILDFIRPGAKLIDVGKRGYRKSCKQPDINTEMIRLARDGLKVVRLKSGDPLIFGRAGEEIEACQQAGVPIDVIPGVTSAQGAAANLKVALTNRDHARRLQFITAHDRRGHLPADIDWGAVADTAATTVVYMPKRTLAELTEIAIAHGLDPNTPAIAVANATRPDQQVFISSVGAIAAALSAANPDGPVLIMIGEALRYADAANATEQASAMAAALGALPAST